MFNHLVQGDGDSADKHREFYDEYLAVMDLTAEYLPPDASRRCSSTMLLPKGDDAAPGPSRWI